MVAISLFVGSVPIPLYQAHKHVQSAQAEIDAERVHVDRLMATGAHVGNAGSVRCQSLPWPYKLTGDPPLSPFTLVEWDSAVLGDAELAGIAALQQVEHVVLRNCSIDARALVHLHALPRLYRLDLNGSTLQPHSLKELARINPLINLNLSRAQVSDDDLAALKHLPSLKHLDLSETSITDDGLKHLASCTSLEELNLSTTQVTSVGLAHLSALKQLQSLDVSGCTIGEAELRQIEEHVNRKINLILLETSDDDADELGIEEDNKQK